MNEPIMTGDKFKKLAIEKGWKVIRNQSFESYVDELEEQLEDAQNSLAGADGKVPEWMVQVITNDSTIITLQGDKTLKNGWPND